MTYYIRLRGKVFGPFDEIQLVKMKNTGKVGRTTEISMDGIIWKVAASFEVLYPAPPTPPPTTPESVPPKEPAEWFYSADGSEGFGPLTKSAVVDMVRSRQLSGRSYVWRQGENARLLKNVVEFTDSLPTTRSTTKQSGTKPYVLFGGIGAVLVVLLCILGIVIGRSGRSTTGTSPVTENTATTKDTEKGGETAVATPPASSSTSTSSTTEEIVEKVEQSIARIEGQYSSGTGFLIRPRILATNYHVISKEFLERAKIVFPSVSEKQKGPFNAKLLYADADRDIAFLGVESTLPVLSLAKEHQFKRGQDIIVVGSPGELENAVNIGVLSSEKEIDNQKYYQLGISINPGNSGGPVMNRNGSVIGIATLKSTEQEGIAYCIPVAHVLEALDNMEKLTESEKANNNSRHRAAVALRMLAVVNFICRDSMKEYDIWMKAAMDRGLSANDGIKLAAEKIDERMDQVQYIFLDNVERELDKIQKDSKLPKEFRIKLAEFYSNCMEIKSYVDNPRGNYDSYKKKMIELADTGDRLHRQLLLLLEVSDD